MTITIRENTVTLKQLEFPEQGILRQEMTIPKQKILMWVRDTLWKESDSNNGGKLYMDSVKEIQPFHITAAEFEALNEGF